MTTLSIDDLVCDIEQTKTLKKISALYTDEKGKTIELIFYKSVVTAEEDELILYASRDSSRNEKLR